MEQGFCILHDDIVVVVLLPVGRVVVVCGGRGVGHGFGWVALVSVATRASLVPKAVVLLADGAATLSFGWLLGVIFQKEEVAMLSEKMRGLE